MKRLSCVVKNRKHKNFRLVEFLRSNMSFAALIVFLGALLSGCGLQNFDDSRNTEGLPVWQVNVVPQTVCVNDSVKVKYRITNECPSGFSCDGFYPTIHVSSSNPMVFPTQELHTMAYSGEVVSNNIGSATPITVNLNSTWDGNFVFARYDSSTPGRPTGAFHAIYTPPVSIVINPIDTGAQSIQPIVFSGQCEGHSPRWTPINLVIDDGVRTDPVRSASVRIRRLCNRDLRMVTFTAHFSSGLPDQDTALMSNECIDIASEAPPAMITSLTARPNTELPGVIMSSCLDTMASSPPAPIRAELTMGCQ